MKNIGVFIFYFIVTIIIIFFLYLKLGSMHYHKNAQKSFLLPGLKDGFINQGIDYKDNNFYMTGYMKDKSNSIVYIYNEVTKKYKKILLNDDNNKPFFGHVGGISVTDKYIYITGDEKGIYVYDYNSFMNCKNNDKVKAIGLFKLNNNEKFSSAFLSIFDNKIYIGEFYKNKKYITENSHHITTKSNDKNNAFVLVYNLDKNKKYGIGDLNYIYSIPDMVQGMSIDKDNIYLSTSYGIALSNIYKFDKSKIKDDKIDIYGTNKKIYYLDSSSLITKMKIAPMSEEIVIKDGYLYVVNESASKKYMFGNLIDGKYCYKIKLSDIK